MSTATVTKKRTILVINGQNHGPYDDNELSTFLVNGSLSPDTLAWQEGFTKPVPVGQLPEFKIFATTQASPMPPPMAAVGPCTVASNLTPPTSMPNTASSMPLLHSISTSQNSFGAFFSNFDKRGNTATEYTVPVTSSCDLSTTVAQASSAAHASPPPIPSQNTFPDSTQAQPPTTPNATPPSFQAQWNQFMQLLNPNSVSKQQLQSTFRIIGIVAGVLLAVVIVANVTLRDSDSDIEMVRSGSFIDFPQVAVGDAIDNFFGNPEWQSFVDGRGKLHYVNVTGTITYANQPAKAVIQFAVNPKTGAFNTRSLEINGEPQNAYILTALIEKMLTE